MHALSICGLLTLFSLQVNCMFLEKSQTLEPNDVTVIVIGGGIAGLTASSKLHSFGYNVQLFEAQGIIGGRTRTVKISRNQHIEIGAEWIHGEKNNSIFELVSPLGLLQDKPLKEFGNEFGFQTGEILNSTLSNRLHDLLHYMWFDPEGWGDILEDNISMGDFARFIQNQYNTEYTIHDDPIFLEAIYDWAHRITNAEDASFNWFEKSVTDNGDQYVVLEGFPNIPWKPPYGFHSLIQLILTGSVTESGEIDLPDWIKLNAPVGKIQYETNSEKVTVTLENGTNYFADHVIFTGSLGVLKEHGGNLFQPQLSASKKSAIEHLGFGTVTKLNYEFEEPWWNEGWEGLFLLWNDHDYNDESFYYWRENLTVDELTTELYDGLPLWSRSILNIFTVDSGSAPFIARIWLTGLPSTYLDLMEQNYIQQVVMKVIHKFLDQKFPNITEPINSFQSNWHSNPYVKGAYSYRTLNSERYDVWAKDLAEPILSAGLLKPLICFAGEATHHNYFSTVHGAYDTGIREFERITKYYAETF